MKPYRAVWFTAFLAAGVLADPVAFSQADNTGRGRAPALDRPQGSDDHPTQGEPASPIIRDDRNHHDEQVGQRGTGVLRHDKGAFEGYTLFAPLRSTRTYLIDMQGRVAHSWDTRFHPGYAVYLLENGHLLGCAQEPGRWFFKVAGGRIQELDWDGSVVWEFVHASDQYMQHHDIEPLPNGNVLLIAWERKSRVEAIAAGRDSETVGSGGLWPDCVIEIKPDRPRGGTIVWRWSVWDHLIQDHDPTKANFGVVADHPELVNINAVAPPPALSPQERRRLESLGYIGQSSRPRAYQGRPDWGHTNSVAYNAELDQIAVSVLRFNELWVIDHSTTTKEAGGHTGGKSGKGGDLLYRWGNPQAYGAGTGADQQLFAQHDVHWITRGRKGAGNLLVFNNGRDRPDGAYSSIVEIVPPVDDGGRYTRAPGTAFGPRKPIWVYTAPDRAAFYSSHVSSAQRLPNGNTLICSGGQGWFFEIDPEGRIVWEYVNPFQWEGRERRASNRPSSRPAPPAIGPDAPADGLSPGRGNGGPPQGPPPARAGSPTGIFRAIRLPADYPGLAGRNLATPRP